MRGHLNRDTLCWLILLLLPLLAHALPAALGLSTNPIYFTADLGNAGLNGLLHGLPGFNDSNTGVTTQALGGLAARQWLHGVVPWWNPYSGVGLPLAAEMQNSALFLPFVLLLNAFDGVIYLKIAMQMLAGLATFALLRQLGAGRRAALLGASLYGLNGTFAWVGHAPIMPVPFLPLLLLGIERALHQAREKTPGGWGWISVALAYSLYSGFPETAFIDGLLALLWAATRFASAGGVRWRFAGKVFVAGVLGLLIAAPCVVPFLEFLKLADIAWQDFAYVLSLDPRIYISFLAPYVYGPIAYDFLGQLPLWDPVGGYLSLAIGVLGLLALAPRRRDLSLRVMLAVWMVLALAKTANPPGVARLFDLIPFMSETVFYRVAPPSWEMAGILLAAFALDDWHRGAEFGRRALAVALGLGAAALATALAFAWPTIRLLAHDKPDYPVYPIISLGWAALVTAALAGLVAARCTRRRSTLLGVVLVFDALALFSFPQLAGTRTPHYDRAAVKFLQAHLGLARFYTLGPFRPNYGAFFGTASINYNYLPVPRRWVDYVHASLDPRADDVNFWGKPLPRPLGAETPVEALRRRLPAYAALGVKYVVAPAGTDPLAESIVIPATQTASRGQALFAGQSVSGAIPGDRLKPGRLDSLAVVIATYAGQANGVLAVRLCTPRDCAQGAVPLAGVLDDALLEIPLAPGLAVNAGDELRYTITHMTGDSPVAIYLWQHPPAEGLPPLASPGGAIPGFAPDLVLSYAPPGLRRVYRDRVMDVYQLPAPAPYFTAGGAACTLTAASRKRLAADCKAPATLIRRELFFPGWRASVNGADARIAAADDIFQAVALPEGRSEIRFSYAPAGIGWACLAFVTGLAGLIGGWWGKI